jgi:hypothetical protein
MESTRTIPAMRPPLLSVLPLLAGCYAYAPIEPAAVRPGTSVRARVSAAGADRIAPLLGASDARRLSGRLVDTRADTMIVEVPSVRQTSLAGMEPLHQRVSIPRSDLLELETRRLDRLRTAAVAGSAAIIVAVLAINALENDPASGGTPPGGGGNEARIPLLRFRP